MSYRRIAAAFSLQELICTWLPISVQKSELASNNPLLYLPLRQPIHSVSPMTAGTLALHVGCTLLGSKVTLLVWLGPVLATAGEAELC